MAKTRIAQKAHRMLDFLVGLGDRRARMALAPHGFTESDLDDGWERLKALSKTGFTVEPDATGLELVSELDAWENRWFPIADLVLRTRFPAVHATVFRNLRQTEGPEVIVLVSTLLDRLEQITKPEADGGHGEEGRAARALLEKRGLSEDVAARARALLARLGRVSEEDAEDVPVDRDARDEAERRLWSWYLEWSGIARIAIRDRRVLRSLGFLRGRSSTESTE